MKKLLLAALLLLPLTVLAQAAAPPAATPEAKAVIVILPQDPRMPALPALKNAPLVVPNAAGGAAPNICNQRVSGFVQTADGNIVAQLPPVSSFAIPWKDAQDNHDKGVTVLNKIASLQNKGGEYSVTISEVVDCDKKGNVRIPSGSIYVEGVTLQGSTEITDVVLQMAKEVNDRYKARARVGMTTGWNHKNAKPTKVNDAGQVVVDDKD